jgi:hypothetical protein
MISKKDADSNLNSVLKNLPRNRKMRMMRPNVAKNLTSSACIIVNIMISSPKNWVLCNIMITMVEDWTMITDRINLKSSSPYLGLLMVYIWFTSLIVYSSMSVYEAQVSVIKVLWSLLLYIIIKMRLVIVIDNSRIIWVKFNVTLSLYLKDTNF